MSAAPGLAWPGDVRGTLRLAGLKWTGPARTPRARRPKGRFSHSKLSILAMTPREHPWQRIFPGYLLGPTFPTAFARPSLSTPCADLQYGLFPQIRAPRLTTSLAAQDPRPMKWAALGRCT